MKIASATLQMSASHYGQQQHEISESLNAWVDTPPSQRITDKVEISDAGKSASASATDKVDQESNADPRLNLIRQMIEMLTGRHIKLLNMADLNPGDTQAIPTAPAAAPATSSPPPRQGWGIDYQHHERYSESEQTSFAASGKVLTADGREISFDLQLSMSRQYLEESDTHIQLGDKAPKTDPLVINFSGNAAELSDQRFRFDLNNDGQKEAIHQLAAGSGYLALDRNTNGQIDNGSELFGPNTGDGFQELAQYDTDHNDWIDENDPVFSRLKIFSGSDNQENSLRSLADMGIGAISLTRAASPFAIRDEKNTSLGEIRSSGVFLREDGTTGTIQQIDLTA